MGRHQRDSSTASRSKSIAAASLLGLLWCLPAFAQSLALSCPVPPKNKPTVCSANLTGSVASLQFNLAINPALSGVTVATPSAGKSVTYTNGVVLVIGMNSTAIMGNVVNITLPKHNGPLTVGLSKIVGSDAGGHAVAISPAVSVTVN